MSNGGSDANLSVTLAQALSLLDASHRLYQGILKAFQDHVDARGEPDLPALLASLNRQVTGFAPRDLEIRRLLARFED